LVWERKNRWKLTKMADLEDTDFAIAFGIT
jgi:hypothetical protein